MIRIAQRIVVAVVFTTAPMTAAAQVRQPANVGKPAATPAAPVVVRTTLSQTAVFVGDPVTYTVEIACLPGADILVADLSREHLRLDGLDLTDADNVREVRPDGGLTYHATFRLASFRTDTESVQIGAIPVRYYVQKSGESAENLQPSDEIEVPAVTIALRSTLPEAGATGIRDGQRWTALPTPFGFMRSVGLAFIALGFVPVLVGVTISIGRARLPRRLRPLRRRRKGQHLAALEQLRLSAAASGPDGRKEAFLQLNALVREFLQDHDVPAASLTPEEIEPRLAGPAARLPAPLVAFVLHECQRARYAGPDELPAADSLSRALVEAGELLAKGRR